MRFDATPFFSAIPLDSETINAIFVITIIAVFLGTIGYMLWRGSKAQGRVEAVHQIVADVADKPHKNARVEMRRTADDTVVRDLWREFDETLVEQDDHLSNTAGAGEFFNTETLAPELVHNRLLAAAPSVLTALGVLGTFVGLTQGLDGITTSGTSEELEAGVEKLIGGAGTAFITSLWGVGLSLLATVSIKLVETRMTKAAGGVASKIDSLFENLGSEHSLVQIMNTSQETVHALGELQENLGERLEKAFDGQMERIAGQAADMNIQVMEQLVERFSEGFQSIGVTLSERLDAASERLTDALDRTTATMDEQAKQHATQMAELRQASAAQVELLSTHLPVIVENLDDAAARTEVATLRFAEASTALETTAGQLAEANTAFGDTLRGTREAAELVATLSDKLSELTLSTTSTAAELAKAAQALDGGYDTLADKQQELVKSLSEFLDSYEREVTKQVNQRMEAWNEHTHAFTSQMVTATQSISTTVGELEERTRSTTAGWEEQTASWAAGTQSYTDQVAAHAEALAVAVGRLQSVTAQGVTGDAHATADAAV
jgi:cbb3-type cytochrome oxidase subunit 3/sugar-specific transcriptional regulator TrmB